MLSFDPSLQRVSRLQSELAPDLTGNDHLALCRNSCEHGKTILPTSKTCRKEIGGPEWTWTLTRFHCVARSVDLLGKISSGIPSQFGDWHAKPQPATVGEGWWAWVDLNYRPHPYQLSTGQLLLSAAVCDSRRVYEGFVPFGELSICY